MTIPPNKTVKIFLLITGATVMTKSIISLTPLLRHYSPVLLNGRKKSVFCDMLVWKQSTKEVTT